MKQKDNSRFEWIKVRTYLTLINGKYAFETLYKKASLNHLNDLCVAVRLFYFSKVFCCQS